MVINIGILEAILRLRDEMTPQLKLAGQSLDRAGTQMKSAGTALLPLSAALGVAGIAALSFATDLNAGMANVATLIPGNTELVLELKEGIQDLAIAHGKSTSDLVEGLYQTISAFGDTAETMKILEINSMAASAGIATTREAINLTSTVTEGYGDTTAAAVEKVTDLAFVAVKLGKTTFPELAASIGNVIPFATSLHVSQEELFATFAALTKVIPSAAEVGTSMRSVLQSMIKPTTEMKDAITELGIKYGFTGAEAMVAQLGMKGSLEALISTTDGSQESIVKLFGRVEALTAAMLITGSASEAVTENMAAMADGAGAAREAFREQTEGINKAGFAWEQFKQKVIVATQKLGDELLPIIMDAATELEPLGQMVLDTMKGFGDLSIVTKTLVVALGGILIISAPLLMFFGQLAIGISAVIPIVGTLTGAVSTLAVALGVSTGGLIFIVGAVVAAFVLLFPWLEDTTRALREQREAADNCATSVKELGGEYISLKDAYEGVERAGGDATEIHVAHTKAVTEDTIALIDFLKSVAPIPGAIDEVAVATQSAAQSLRDEMEATRIAAETKAKLAEASELLGREVTELALAHRVLAVDLANTNAAFDQLTPALEAHGRMVFENVTQYEIARAATQDMIGGSDDWMNTLGELDDQLKDNSAAMTEAGKEAVRAVERTTILTRETASLTDVMGAGTRVMGDIGNALSIVGIDIDSVIGKVTRLISTFESLLGSVSGIIGMFKGGGAGGISLGGGGGLTGLLGGLFSGGGGVTSAAGPTLPAAGGALGGIGGAVSSGASAVMGGISTALAAIPVAGWIALAGIGTVLLTRAIFGEPSAFEQAGTELGNVVGEGFSEGLQWHIAQAGEITGDFGLAVQQNLGAVFGDAIQQATMNFDSMSAAVEAGAINFDDMMMSAADTFSFLERGQISATEAQQILNDAVGWLIPNLGELGATGEAELTRLVNAAQAAGIEFEGLDQLIHYVESGFTSLGIAIDASIGDVASTFDITNKQAKELADLLGVKIKSEAQQMANELGVTPKIFKEIGAAVEAEYGIPLSGIQGLLEMMGVSIEQLGAAFGIEVTPGIREANTVATELKTTLDQMPRDIDININASDRRESLSIAESFPGLQHGGRVEANPPYGTAVRLGEHEAEYVFPESKVGALGTTINLTIAPTIVVTEPLASPEDIERAVVPVVVQAIQDDKDSIVGEMERALERS